MQRIRISWDMELGNMIFGHSRGEISLPRSEGFEDELMRLFRAYSKDGDFALSYGPEFSNNTFEVHPYYWGDCTCGFEERWSEKEEKWTAEHPHAENCYQTALENRTAAYDSESGYPELQKLAFPDGDPLLESFDMAVTDHGDGYHSFVGHPRSDAAMERWRKAHSKRDDAMNAIYKELCQEFNLPMVGCAVHCTCGRDALFAEFSGTDRHDERCPLVLPNFLYKPTSFSIMWYKYPLRDSYASEEISLAEFSKIIDACIASLTP